MRMWTVIHTIRWPNEVLAASPDSTPCGHIRGCSIVCRWEDGLSRLIYLCCYPKQSQTKFIWSLAPVHADVDSATHDMVAQCGAGGQPKLDLLRTHTRLSWPHYARYELWTAWFTLLSIPNNHFLVASTGRWRCGQRYTRYVGPMWCWRQAQITPPQDTDEIVVSFVGETMVWAAWFTFATILNEHYLVTSTGSCRCWQCYTRNGGPMWCWRPAQIGPPQGTYEVVMTALHEMMVLADWFTFPTIPNKLYLVASSGECGCGHRYTRYVGPMWCWRQAQIGPSQDTYEIVVLFVGQKMVWAAWFTFDTIPNKLYLVTSTGSCRCWQCYTRYGGPMRWWRPAQIGPPQVTHEVVALFVGETMVWAAWFTFATIPNKVWLVASSGSCRCWQRYIRYGGPMWS